jgi:hypothetical protein
LAGIFGGDINCDPRRLARPLRQLVGGGSSSTLVEIGYQDVRSRFDEGPGDAEPDADGPTGDDCVFAL